MLTDVWGLESEKMSDEEVKLYNIYNNADCKMGFKTDQVNVEYTLTLTEKMEVAWNRFVNGMNSTLDGYFYDAQDMYNNPGKIAEAVKNIPRMVTESLPRCEIVNSPNDMSGGQSIGSAAGMSVGDIAEAAGEAVGELFVRAPLLMASGAANAVKQIAEEAVHKGADVAKQALDNTNYIGYKSFYRFKKAYGTAGKGYAWHHIVEQNRSNLSKFGAEAIHNINNLIKLPHGKGSIHAKISGHYSSIQDFTNGKTVRQWLSSQSYQEQYDYGIKMLKQYGWTP